AVGVRLGRAAQDRRAFDLALDPPPDLRGRPVAALLLLLARGDVLDAEDGNLHLGAGGRRRPAPHLERKLLAGAPHAPRLARRLVDAGGHPAPREQARPPPPAGPPPRAGPERPRRGGGGGGCARGRRPPPPA